MKRLCKKCKCVIDNNTKYWKSINRIIICMNCFKKMSISELKEMVTGSIIIKKGIRYVKI